MSSFMQLTIPERIQTIYTEKNSDYIYEILSKYLQKSVGDLKGMYNIGVDYIKNILEFRGDATPIYYLFELATKVGLKFDGFNTNFLRFDLSIFIQTLK